MPVLKYAIFSFCLDYNNSDHVMEGSNLFKKVGERSNGSVVNR